MEFFLQGSHLDNFLLKTLKLDWVAFHSVTLKLKCLDFQSNQYKKLVPVLSRFCNGLLVSPYVARAHPRDFVARNYLLASKRSTCGKSN